MVKKKEKKPIPKVSPNKYSIGGTQLSKKEYISAKQKIAPQSRGGEGAGIETEKSKGVVAASKAKDKAIIERKKIDDYKTAIHDKELKSQAGKEINAENKEVEEPEEQRLITQQEIDAGLVQEDIDNGLTMASTGSIMPVTAEDVLTASSVAGAGKAVIGGVAGKIAGKIAAKKGGQAVTSQIARAHRISTFADLNEINPKLAEKLLVESGQIIKSGIQAVTGATKAKIIAGATIGTVYAIDNFLLSPTETPTWAAADNVVSGLSFQANLINDAYNQNIIDRETAMSMYEDAEDTVKLATEFINMTTSRNPKLWPSRNMYMAAADVGNTSIALRKSLLG